MKSVFRLSLVVAWMIAIAASASAQLVRQNNSTLKFPTVAGPVGQYDLVDLMPGVVFDRAHDFKCATLVGKTHHRAAHPPGCNADNDLLHIN